MAAQPEVLEALHSLVDPGFTEEELRRLAAKPYDTDRKKVCKMLRRMLDEGRIVRTPTGYYRVP